MNFSVQRENSQLNKAQDIINEDITEVVANIVNYLPEISGKTFLITGPNGLLASYLVDTLAYLNSQKLVDIPCKVIGLQRSDITAKSRLGHLLGRTDIVLYKHDVKTPYKFNDKIDYIIHAAGRSAPATFQSDPLGTIDVNVQGIRWLLDLAVEQKVKSFLFMSSGEIYGNPSFDNIPTKESYNGNVSTLAPRACYTESKRLAETLCSIYYKKSGVPTKIARPFIVYGPGLPIDDRRVMADFMRAGIEKKPITMLSDGSDMRSYCYITDATVLFFRLLFSNYNADPFNIANGNEEISIKELAELVHEICEIPEPVKIDLYQNSNFVKDAPTRVCPDMSKARELLGFIPTTPIKKGLRRTIEWNKLNSA